jgi:hypothetical protein
VSDVFVNDPLALPGPALSWKPGEPPVGQSALPQAAPPPGPALPDYAPYGGANITGLAPGSPGYVSSRLAGEAAAKGEAQTYVDRRAEDQMAQDRQKMAQSYALESAAASDPALRPWNAEQEKAKYIRGPMENFGSVGMIFAMAASAFTRTPMISALNAGAAAMQATAQSDEKAYKQAFDAWKSNSDLALKRFDMERNLYEDANKLLTTDMGLWKQKSLMLAAQFDNQKMRIMLENGMDKEVLDAQAAQFKAAEEMRKSQFEFEKQNFFRQQYADSIKEYQDAHPGVNDKNKTPEYVAFKAKAWSDALRASQGEMTPEQLAQLRGQQGRVTSSMDQVTRITERAQELVGEGMSPTRAHDQAAKEVLAADAKARASGRDKIDQSLVNELEHYPGMTKEDLGTVLPARQPKLIAAFESAKNIEGIAEYAKQNPEAVGLVAEASRRMNLDAYQGLFNNMPGLKAKTESDRDNEIDKVAKERKLDLTQAAKAKVLQKMLTTQSFADAATAGSRGGTIYLDKAFREIYQQASSPGAFFSILEKRYDEADRIVREYKMGFDERDDLDKMPFWTGKAKEYAGTTVNKPPVPGAVQAKDGWYVKATPEAPGARKAKDGTWWVKVSG